MFNKLYVAAQTILPASQDTALTIMPTTKTNTALLRPPTLPDYLRRALRLVFIGLNPGLYSAQQGKYFARATNRFWPALTASNFFGRKLQPGDERWLFEQGIGFTDVVPRASGQIDELARAEILAGAKLLRRKLLRLTPQVACFVGITGYRWMFDLPARAKVIVGPQMEKIGKTLLYVLPSTSPANAHYSLDETVAAFQDFKRWLDLYGISLSLPYKTSSDTARARAFAHTVR